ncbi:MFS transporter [Gemmobacter lanyuensis]
MLDAKRGRWAVAAMFMVNGFAMGAWAPQIPLLLPRHGIGEGAMGLLILGLGLGAVSAMLFAGRLIQRFGSRFVLTGFATLLVPVLPLIVLAPTVPLLALAMMVFGAVAGCMDVAMNANAVEVERRLGRAIMSSSHGFWSLGGFLGGSLGSLIIGAAGPVTQAGTVAIVMALTVMLARPFLMQAPAPPAPRTIRPRPSFRARRLSGCWASPRCCAWCPRGDHGLVGALSDG